MIKCLAQILSSDCAMSSLFQNSHSVCMLYHPERVSSLTLAVVLELLAH